MTDTLKSRQCDPIVEPPNYKPPTSAKELLARYKAGERYFVGAHLGEAEIKDRSLAGANLSGSRLIHVRFKRCNLEATSFRDAQLLESKIETSRLNNADFTGAFMANTSLGNHELHGTDFRKAKFVETELLWSKFDRAHFGHTEFVRVDLAASEWNGAMHHSDSRVDDVSLFRTAEGLITRPENTRDVEQFLERCGVPLTALPWRANKRRRTPPRVGQWTPKRKIGSGGNGEVWRAVGEDGRKVAVKYLRWDRTSRAAYRRFRDEIAVMAELKDLVGVMPLLDHGLPETPTRDTPAWLATPLAVPFPSADPTCFEAKVGAFARIASTLAELANRNIAHRDIKPDNLFWLDGEPVVGDFGLVDFPGKEAITKGEQKLGPMFFIAPEMLNDPVSADGKSADVYSLAKTLWVVATGNKYPIPGEQRESVYETRLSTYVGHRRARPLDRLISACTQHDPQRRPTMTEVASELQAWLDGRTEIRPTRPRKCTNRELAKVGVQLTDPDRVILHCRVCWQGWSPNIQSGGRMPHGYWKCPNGCNHD